MVDAQTIGVLMTGVSVTVAAIYYMFTLRTNQRNYKTTLDTRQAQLYMQMYQLFISKDFQKQFNEILTWSYSNLDDFEAKYGKAGDLDKFSELTSTLNFFEGIGVLIKKGYIDKMMVDDLMSGFIMGIYEWLQPVTSEYRVRHNYPQAFEWVEYLYNEIKSIAVSEHPELKLSKIEY